MSEFPDVVRVQLMDMNSKYPVSNIVMTVKLFANHKNDYIFVLPLSDERGCIEITKKWLQQEIKKEQEIFVMDYASMLEDCLPQIELSILSDEAVSRAVNAMYLYQDATGISDDEIAAYSTADNSKYLPHLESIKLESKGVLSIEIALKPRV